MDSSTPTESETTRMDRGGRLTTRMTRPAPSAGPAITEVAAEIGADVIVMGTHGRGGFDRVVMGSVAEYVLRRAPCAVLTVGPSASESLGGPILAAIEFGAEGGVLEAAVGLAFASGSPLLAFHAVEPLILPAPYAMEISPGGMDTLIVDAKEALANRLALMPLGSQVASEVVVEAGMAVPEILDLAVARRASLIVQGSHGRKGLSRAWMGSVAESVARRAPCPVLTLRRGARPLAVTERDALAEAMPVPRKAWADTLDSLSTRPQVEHWAVSVGVVAQDARGLILDGVRLRGLTYDPHDDAIDVITESTDHRIARPLSLRLVRSEDDGPFTLEVIRRDGARERIAASPAPVLA